MSDFKMAMESFATTPAVTANFFLPSSLSTVFTVSVSSPL